MADGVTISTSHNQAPGNANSTGITAFLNDATATGNVSIDAINSSVTTTGHNSYGIYTVNKGQGDVQTTTSSQITTGGENADGAIAFVYNTASTGNATVNQTAGNVTTAGTEAVGLDAINTGQGNATVTAAGTVTTSGDGSSAIAVYSSNGVNTSRATALVSDSARLRTSGQNSNALFVNVAGNSQSAINIVTSGTIQTSGANSSGLKGTVNSAVSTAPISVALQGGSITTASTSASGVLLTHQGSGSITVDGSASSSINTTGAASHGIEARAANGGVALQLSGTSISTSGIGAAGLLVAPIVAGSATTANIASGAIVTRGDNAHGVVAGIDAIGPDTTVFNTANVVTTGTINASGMTSVGVAAISSNNTAVSANADIAASGKFGVGLMATSTAGSTAVNIGQGVNVTGGWQDLPTGTSGQRFDASSAGIVLGGATTLFVNNGNIGALSDRAIASSVVFTPAAGDTTINNYGTITGYLSLNGGGQNTFNNYSSNSLVLRHFADTNGDGVRDTKRVAISDFAGPNAVFNNTATGAIRLGDASNAAFTDATGYYQPKTGADARTLDPSFYDLNRNGVVQGQLVNLSTFNNAGVIDLRGSALGNTLVITDQPTANAGVGTGVYVSNGGSLKLNAPLQAGLAAGGVTGSESDMLIVDRTRLGTGATQVEVSKAPTSLGALTTGNGIELIEVRDAANSADGAFSLGHRVAAGAYEYTLHKGGTGADTDDGNWYLRSFVEPTPTPPTPVAPPIVPNYRQEVPLNMAMPALANRVGLSMLGTYHDRQGQDSLVSFNSSSDANKQNATWGRIIAEQGSTKYGSGDIQRFQNYGPSYDFTLGGFQIGLDAYRETSKNGKNFDQAGAYIGVAHIDSNVDDFAGTRAGTAKLTGYSLGGYWTRIAESGAYIDAVGQITYYADAKTRSRLGGRLKPMDGDSRLRWKGDIPST